MNPQSGANTALARGNSGSRAILLPFCPMAMTGSSTRDSAPAPRPFTARERLEAGLVRWARRVLALLPLSWASALGGAFGSFIFRVTGFARAQALRNLDVAFGATLTPGQRRAVAGRCYRLFGASLFEFLCLPRLQPADVPRHIALENREVLDQALAQGKGVLLFVAHFGSWEILEAGLIAAGYRLTLYAGGQRNTLVDDQINEIRTAIGAVAVRRSSGARGLLRALKAGHITALVADQHESTKRHYVSFFGQPVSAAPGPYTLARHSGAPVVYATSLCVGRFRYRATFEALPPPALQGDEELDLLAFTQRAFAVLERKVRAHPDHYFWMHRRFRPIPWDTSLTDKNRAFLKDKLSGPLEGFWEPTPPGAVKPEAVSADTQGDPPASGRGGQGGTLGATGI